ATVAMGAVPWGSSTAEEQNSVGSDLRGDVLGPARVGPHTGLKPPLHQNITALAQVLRGPLAERGPGHDLMPLCVPLLLAASLPDDLVRRHREPRHLLLIAERPHFRITTQVPNEDHMVHHDLLLLPARAFPKGATLLRAFIWAVTVTGDQPPPTRCPAPSQSSPSELFWLALSLTAGGSRQKSPIRNARSATSMCGWEPRGPTGKPVTGAGSMRLARRLGPAAVAGRRRRRWRSES